MTLVHFGGGEGAFRRKWNISEAMEHFGGKFLRNISEVLGTFGRPRERIGVL